MYLTPITNCPKKRKKSRQNFGPSPSFSSAPFDWRYFPQIANRAFFCSRTPDSEKCAAQKLLKKFPNSRTWESIYNRREGSLGYLLSDRRYSFQKFYSRQGFFGTARPPPLILKIKFGDLADFSFFIRSVKFMETKNVNFWIWAIFEIRSYRSKSSI